ncbi:MAG: hypothetical protein RRY21_02365 [Oscillospiraceae bacterium]
MEGLLLIGILAALGIGGLRLFGSFDRFLRTALHPFWDEQEEHTATQKHSLGAKPR